MAIRDDQVRRLRVAGEDVEFTDQGDGEPVLLGHGGVFSDWFVPVTHVSRRGSGALLSLVLRTVR